MKKQGLLDVLINDGLQGAVSLQLGQHEGDGLFLNFGHFGKAHAFHSLVDGFAALQLAVKHLDNSVLYGVFLVTTSIA